MMYRELMLSSVYAGALKIYAIEYRALKNKQSKMDYVAK